MKLGLFMMPLHDPRRDYLSVLNEDRQSILLADQLGYDEAWVGEHYACKTEPIANPLQFMATLLPVTRRIVFGSAVLNLPQHHPAQVAGDVAQFDHLAEGRFIMGVGPGGLGSDFELFETLDKNRADMLVESVETIHAIWRSDPPYRIQGKYWSVVVEKQYQPALGIGPMLKPYQKPYPPLVVSAMSPHSSTATLAGERGWGLISANFAPSSQVRTHWEACCTGAERSGRRPDRANWRVARSIICTATDAEAAEYLADETSSPNWYYAYLRENFRNSKLLRILKDDAAMPDEALTIRHLLDTVVIAGSPGAVLDRLIALVDEIGPFGTLLVTQKDWDRPALYQASMRLIANEVMPRLRQHLYSSTAAQ
jgi:alkanesulfonate monooxygenase SsuD/methylene tetrahydromethanopterin reductase-like flavin-dependent oxidoreductase (luciferase family)